MALQLGFQLTEVTGMLMPVTQKRAVIKAATTADAAEKIKAVADRYGMKDYVVFGKLMDWFAAQDDLYQRSVLGLLEGLSVDAARAYMEREAERAASVPPGQTLVGPNPSPAAQQLTDAARRERQGREGKRERDATAPPPPTAEGQIPPAGRKKRQTG